MLRWFDGLGRDTLTSRKRATRVADTTYMRWERTITRYLVTNQVDSMRSEVTEECVMPCTIPPAWPTAVADSLRWQHVKYAYDRLGRDTARFNTRDKRTRYVYDGLGRLRARYPFGDSTAVVDSFRYDIGGNLRYHWTRRGALIEHRYDSRSRDTLTLVPSVGDYRRTYAGPNDELTRLTIANYVDSIGGVNPNVSLVYNQSGQLISDTAQGNRVGAYLYDRYGRDTLTTDVRGTSRYRYDAVRGMLDSVFTPYGDTLRWTIDGRWRHVGPYIHNGADPDFSTVPTWDQAGKLTRLLTSQGAGTLAVWQLPTDESLVADLFLVPQFTDPLGTAEDSLGHDGWGRVTSVRYRKNSAYFAIDSFEFDRDGNANVIGGMTYDVATTRMLVGHTGYTHTYDRAGNLVSRTAGSVTYAYTYDALDRLIAYRENGALVARYAYDALGRRIVKRVYPPAGSAAYLRMIYRGDHVVAETDSVGASLTLGYVWGPGVDNLVAVRRYSDSQTWYVIQDVLHSVRGLTRRDGTWAVSWRYRIYGSGLDSAGTAPFALRYRWTGREFDAETGLYFFRARYYDPRVWRFIQEDPIGFAGGANLFAYAGGNPTNGRDPDGLKKEFADHAPPEESKFNPFIDGGGGGSWRRGEAWEDWFGNGGFSDYDMGTWAERTSTGRLEFTSLEALKAYQDLKEAAMRTNNEALQGMLRDAEGRYIIIALAPGLRDLCPGGGLACSFSSETFSYGTVRGVLIDASYEEVRGSPYSIALAHELGHLVPAGIGYPNTPVPSHSPSASEPSAFHWEREASRSYGCPVRPWDHSIPIPPCAT